MNELTINHSPLHNGNGTSVQISGSLKAMNALDLKTELHKFIGKRQHLIVDITGVTEMDLTGLNTLMFTKIKCSIKYSDMTLIAGDQHPIMKLVRLTKSEGQFNFQKSVVA